MKLSGIELRNFRSIGDQPVILSPFKKVNILVGKNNSGKSNALEAVRRILTALRKEAPKEGLDLTDLDQHNRSADNRF